MRRLYSFLMVTLDGFYEGPNQEFDFVPLYAIDDQTAIKVVDGAVTVVSEGEWNRFEK